MKLGRRAAAATEEPDDRSMSLVEHLSELRMRIVKCVVAVVVGMIAVYFLYNPIYRFATQPYCDSIAGTRQESCDLYFFGLVEGFSLRLRVSMYLGVLAALPVILWQFWKFIAPGLYKRERRYAFGFVGSSLALFALGATLAYFTLAKMFQWLIQAAGEGVIQNRAEDYFRLLTLMVIAFGVGFEFPLVLAVAQAVGLVTPDQLAAKRRHAMVGIVAVVAMLTPGGDPISLVALSIPLALFYEASIWVGRALLKRRA